MMYKELEKHQIVSHYQLIVDEFQGVTMIGYNPVKDWYQVTIFEYVKSSERAKKPLKELTKKMGPYKQFSQVKKITSNYSKVINAKGLLGTIRFLQGHYLLYIEQIQPLGSINNKQIFTISKISIIPLFHKFNDSSQADQQKYYQLISTCQFQNLYFSYVYDLSSTYIQNLNGQSSSQFVWNYSFKEEVSQIVGQHWVPNVIHGYFNFQKNITVRLTNTTIKCDLVVVSRRNRHQDGVRYLKRGINQYGYVANHVETQQIISSSQGISSFIMIRGSVPVYWKQKPSFVVFQPKIQVMEQNSQYQPAQKHFNELVRRFGANIHCINLLRQQQSKPRQGLLTNEFMKLVDQISNQQKKGIFYYQFDVKKQLKNFQVFQKQVIELSYYLLLQTGVNIITKDVTTLQHGVSRINCVDCLDRTNLFMSLLGQIAFIFQIKYLAKQPITINDLTLKKQFLQMYSSIHERLGNAVSLQYGGSEAHKHRSKINKSEILVSLKRHISNNTSDYIKQQQIDICNGIFSRTKPFIWQEGYVRIQKSDSKRNFNTRQWLQQASTQYLLKNVRPNMDRVEDGQLQTLRDAFMKSSIPIKHISIKQIDITWATPLQYKIKPSYHLQSQNVIQQIRKFKSRQFNNFQQLNQAQSLIQQLVQSTINNGGFDDKDIKQIQPFIRKTISKKAL